MTNPIAGNAALVLLIGAAHSDATAGQRAALRAKILPLMEEYGEPSTSPARVRQLLGLVTGELFRIMGDDWEIPEAFKRQIDWLLS